MPAADRDPVKLLEGEGEGVALLKLRLPVNDGVSWFEQLEDLENDAVLVNTVDFEGDSVVLPLYRPLRVDVIDAVAL